MSSGYAGAYADTISVDDIKKVCRSQWSTFEMALGMRPWEDFVYSRYQEDELDPDILFAFDNLRDAFHKKTGLCLDADYHASEDNGDIFDDVKGAYWCVGDVFVESPEYKKAKKTFGISVNRRMFVQYG